MTVNNESKTIIFGSQFMVLFFQFYLQHDLQVRCKGGICKVLVCNRLPAY